VVLVAVCAVLCGLATLPVAAVVARLPEPEEPPVRRDDEAPRPTYAAVGSARGFRAGAAVVAALLGGVLAAAVGATWALVLLAVLVPPGVVLAYVDLRTRMLPNRLVFPAYAVVVPLALLGRPVSGDWDGVVGSTLGWAAGGGFFLLLWLLSPASLGYGDVRLAGLIGIVLGHLGWAPVLLGLWSGLLLGGVGGLLLRALDRHRSRAYPLGPFLLLGVVVGVLLGPAAGSWALSGP
jgi:leader peptidase (prepilin peptidase) / N-methyltransferase